MSRNFWLFNRFALTLLVLITPGAFGMMGYPVLMISLLSISHGLQTDSIVQWLLSKALPRSIRPPLGLTKLRDRQMPIEFVHWVVHCRELQEAQWRGHLHNNLGVELEYEISFKLTGLNDIPDEADNGRPTVG